MTFKQFKIFAAVARHCNLTLASKDLRISQPGVSQQLKLLEQGFGVKLFRRGGRGIDLTDAGWLFLNKITPILHQVEDLNRTFGPRMLAPERETLIVGGTYSTSASLLPSLLAVFKKRHPRVELALRTGDRHLIERLLLASEIEIALVAGSPRSDRLIAEPYRRYGLVVIVPKNHPLAKKPKLSAPDLAGVPLIIRGGVNQKSTTENLLRGSPIQRLNIAMRCEWPETVKVAVREGIGIGILYEDAVKPEIKKDGFKIVKLSDLKLEGESWVVYRRDMSLSPVAADFLALLRDRRDNDRTTLGATRRLMNGRNAPYGRPSFFGPPRSEETSGT